MRHIIVLLALSGSLLAQSNTASFNAPSRINYLYAHFRDDDQNGLYLSYSADAYHWADVKPEGSFHSTDSIRDPSVIYEPDPTTGVPTFYFVSTPTGANFSKIQLYSSTDLQNFSPITTLDVSTIMRGGMPAVTSFGCLWWHDPNDLNTYLSCSISFDFNTPSGGLPTFYPYLFQMNMHTLTSTAITPLTITGTTRNTNWEFYPYYDGTKYYMFYEDVQPIVPDAWPNQQIAYATASTLTGTYTQQTPDGVNYFGWGDFNTEAPKIIPLGSSPCVRIQIDHWTYSVLGNGSAGRVYHPVYKDSCPATASSLVTSDGTWTFGSVLTVGNYQTKLNGTVNGSAVMMVDVNGVVYALSNISGSADQWYVYHNGAWSMTNQPPATSTFVAGQIMTGVGMSALFSQTSLIPTQVSAPIPYVISRAENGNVITVTDSNAALRIEEAAAAGRMSTTSSNLGGRFGIGTTSPPYLFTIKTKLNPPYGLLNMEPATIAADPGSGEIATLTACGAASESCPLSAPGTGIWDINQDFQGGFGLLQISNWNTDTDGGGLALSHGVRQFGHQMISASPNFDRSRWLIAENPPSVVGTGDWFTIFNAGYGETRAVTGQSVSSSIDQVNGCYGMKFTVGASNIFAVAGGRYTVSGNSQGHFMYLLDSTGATIGFFYAAVSLDNTTPGEYSYVPLSSTGGSPPVPIELMAGTSYYLMSSENAFFDGTADSGGTTVTTNGSIAVNGGYFQSTCGSGVPTGATNPGHTYGPVDLIYSTTNGIGTVGAHLLQISPWTGEVRVTNGITFGTGDSSDYNQTDYASMDTYGIGGTANAPGINFGNGTFGTSNAALYAGAVRAGVGIIPAGWVGWMQSGTAGGNTELGIIRPGGVSTNYSSILMGTAANASSEYIQTDSSDDMYFHQNSGSGGNFPIGPWIMLDGNGKVEISSPDYGYGVVQINDPTATTGESSILLANALTSWGHGVTPTSTDGNHAIWLIGENNAAFGSASHYFSIYNRGLNGYPLYILPTTGEVHLPYTLTIGGLVGIPAGYQGWVQNPTLAANTLFAINANSGEAGCLIVGNNSQQQVCGDSSGNNWYFANGGNITISTTSGVAKLNDSFGEVQVSSSGIFISSNAGTSATFGVTGSGSVTIGSTGIGLNAATVVNGTLNVNGGTGYQIGGTNGVTCTGSPTASFASIDGIVTHC